jgi:2-phospho-L-lactate guanylyltransferase (CobY/MobA/RfbA family)
VPSITHTIPPFLLLNVDVDTTQDLEDLMLMEAIRLSLIDNTCT